MAARLRHYYWKVDGRTGARARAATTLRACDVATLVRGSLSLSNTSARAKGAYKSCPKLDRC